MDTYFRLSLLVVVQLAVASGLAQVQSESQALQTALIHAWEGYDGDEFERAMIKELIDASISSSTSCSSEHTLGNATKKMVLLSPYDAGSNLMLQTLRLNYPDHVAEACSWNDAATPTYGASTVMEHCTVWKHGMGINGDMDRGNVSLEAILQKKSLAERGMVLVAMVRSPLAQLASWMHAPYDLAGCVGNGWDNLDKACDAMVEWKSTGMYDHKHVKSFMSAVDVYNHYLRLYRQIEDARMFTDVLIVNYEDLVYTPEVVLMRIAEAMDWPENSEMLTFEAAAKGHGQSIGRDAALAKLSSRSFLDDLSDATRKVLCAMFDEDAIGTLAEGNYPEGDDDMRRPYMQDCRDD